MLVWLSWSTSTASFEKRKWIPCELDSDMTKWILQPMTVCRAYFIRRSVIDVTNAANATTTAIDRHLTQLIDRHNIGDDTARRWPHTQQFVSFIWAKQIGCWLLIRCKINWNIHLCNRLNCIHISHYGIHWHYLRFNGHAMECALEIHIRFGMHRIGAYAKCNEDKNKSTHHETHAQHEHLLLRPHSFWRRPLSVRTGTHECRVGAFWVVCNYAMTRHYAIQRQAITLPSPSAKVVRISHMAFCVTDSPDAFS